MIMLKDIIKSVIITINIFSFAVTFWVINAILKLSEEIAVSDFDLDLGPWESVFYGEFDGQRDKRIMIKVIGE